MTTMLENKIPGLPGLLVGLLLINLPSLSEADPIQFNNKPVELVLSKVSDHTIRVSLKHISPSKNSVPVDSGRVLVKSLDPTTAKKITDLDGEQAVDVGNLLVHLQPAPLRVKVSTKEGDVIQRLRFDNKNDNIRFELGNGPIFGLGNGGQYFNRRGSFFSMKRGHRRGEFHVFGARTPIPFLIGTDGWSMFVHRPYNVRFDLRDTPGKILPEEHPASKKEATLPLDLFITDLDQPSRALSEYTKLTGRPPMPPKWSLGYMQSHRNLSGPEEVLRVARTFREKQLPADALIYLGTGFTPDGWNTGHGDFKFNPETFPNPQSLIDSLHAMNFKISLHLTSPPNDLHGHIPPRERETVDSDHVYQYWQEHLEIFNMGIDGWWPDMGDPLDNDERLTRHYMYRKGPLTERPDERPWSLHRTGYAGMQRFGGWIWSGDVRSSWKSLEKQIPHGINASLSTSPFWGTDIGGFFPLDEMSGELYARWFQFGAFTPIFRSHGRVWRTRLPWGWNPGEMGPVQLKEFIKGKTKAPDTLNLEYRKLDLHNPKIEPVVSRYIKLRYRLMPYLYSAVRETYEIGMPIMRAMWLHYPDDSIAVRQEDQYLWGRDMLIAPVTRENARVREIYLPEGKWYDFWIGKLIPGEQHIRRYVDLETMPIYVKAGTILPIAPVRQYVGESVDQPMTLRIYPGENGEFQLYRDDGKSLDYREGEYSKISIQWNDETRTLTLEPSGGESVKNETFRIEIVGERTKKNIDYQGEKMEVALD